MYRMYLAECVCIDAPNNFSCRKYKQIHAIQTNTGIIHTPIFPKYIQKYIKNKSVTMCLYVHVFACICMYFVCIFCMSVFFCIQRHNLMCMLYVYVFACICMYWVTVTVHPWVYVCSWATLSITCCRANEKGPFDLKFCFIFQTAAAG